MTLVDAGPLVAVIDTGEPRHDECRRVLATLTPPLVTTWPAFTEAMHLVARTGGALASAALWRLLLTDRLEIVELSRSGVERAAALMEKYSDRPMDLADATLVALAEQHGDRRIFTLDNDFLIYRVHGRHRFTVIPST